MADLVNAYIDVELCEMENNDIDVHVPEIPKVRRHQFFKAWSSYLIRSTHLHSCLRDPAMGGRY